MRARLKLCIAFALLAAAAAAIVAGSVTGPAGAAPGESQIPAANPDLVAACGIDIHVILDESDSIRLENATEPVRDAFRAFTRALANTGSRLAVSEFSTVARLPLAGAANREYTTVTDATIATIFDPYITTGYQPNGITHWEDAFRIGRYFLPRPSPTTPHLVVVITDGDPNGVVNEVSVTYQPGSTDLALNEYELKVPLANSETDSADYDAAKDRAVPNANALKAQGSHILAVAVGPALTSQSSLDRLMAVSGPDVFPNTPFDIATTDVYREPNFDELEDALRAAAFQLCAPSVNVRKLIDLDAGPDEFLQPDDGWSMTLDITSGPPPSSWISPPTGSGTSATTLTGPDGFANFQWRTQTPAAAEITVTEQLQTGFVNDPLASLCAYRTPAQPTDQPLPGFSPITNGFIGTVPAESIVTCRMVNRVVPTPAVTIVKSTNGVDANNPPGPFVPAGEPVNWTYLVTNTGNVPLANIAVADAPPAGQPTPTVTCLETALDPGEETTCTASGTAIGGQYMNTATVTATSPAGPPAPASDPSHYFGAVPGVNIEKLTNGEDADIGFGPFLEPGDPITWTYVVTNMSTPPVPLANVVVTDTPPFGQPAVTPLFVGGDTNANGLLDPGEAWTYVATGTAVVSQPRYENVGSVQATAPGPVPVADSDPSHYSIPQVEIEKFTNQLEADTPPGPFLPVGSTVTWPYVVTNTGNVPLVGWGVTDNQAGVAVACPRGPAVLSPGRTVTCLASGTVVAGQYTNVGTVTATTFGGTPPVQVSADDPANYAGVQGEIDLEKLTNGQDADRAPGPAIPVGGAVTWTYQVTNTGNSELTGIAVVDLQTGGVTCPQTTLAAGAGMVCTATGTAEPDQYSNLAFVRGTTAVGGVVRDIDPSHYVGATPGILLQKYTNGVDADTARGPLIAVGEPVDWTYRVTNTGNQTLTGIAVTDDQRIAVTCPRTTLAVGEELDCTATGTARLGQYANVGTVTARAGEAVLSDTDPSHYFGVVSRLDVEKLTNGLDADTAPGPSIPVGGAVRWTYRVTNPGNVAVRTIRLVDDRGVVPTFTGGDADRDADLDPGETWLYEAAGTAAAGQYRNVATVTGLDVLENPLTDTDPSHYFGLTPSAPRPPTASAPAPPARSTVRVLKSWVGGAGRTTIYVDRTGQAPYDASALADSSGDRASFTYAVGTRVTVGESRVPAAYTATINCGQGRRSYTGRPFPVTSPTQAGAILTCTIVNTRRPPPPPQLVISKRSLKRVVEAGETVRFLLSVRNRGRGTARNVFVCDRLPDGLVFVRAPGARFRSGDACWTIRLLPRGGRRNFVAVTRALRTPTREVVVNVLVVTAANSNCDPRVRVTRTTARVNAACRSRRPVIVMPARAGGVAGGVTG